MSAQNAPPSSPTSATPEEFSTYAKLNSPSSAEQEIEGEIERVASGLFSVVATMGTYYFAGPLRES